MMPNSTPQIDGRDLREIMEMSVLNETLIFDPVWKNNPAIIEACGKCGQCGQCGVCGKSAEDELLTNVDPEKINTLIANNPALLEQIRNRFNINPGAVNPGEIHQ